MKLEEQVTNLKLSQKLQELGIKQESLFYWDLFFVGGIYKIKRADEMNVSNWKYVSSAFTVAELGDMLPRNTYTYSNGDLWYCKTHLDNLKNNKNILPWDNTEANARAKLLIYLIENKLIEK